MRTLALLALAACGAATPTPTQTFTPTPSQSPTLTPTQTQALTCKSNDECAMSTLRSCCSSCSAPPFADFKSEVDALRNKCAVVECAKREPDECKPTESIDAFHAECRSSACVAVRNPPARLSSTAACTKDADCVVSNFHDCCGCPKSAYATTRVELTRREHECETMKCVMSQVACDPEVDASLYSAVCRAGTCTGVKR